MEDELVLRTATNFVAKHYFNYLVRAHPLNHRHYSSANSYSAARDSFRAISKSVTNGPQVCISMKALDFTIWKRDQQMIP